jgi:anti-sigma28 factor (negative regulator of flagellin synthesis)
MTVLAVTYDTRLGRFGRRRDGDQDPGRRTEAARDDATMDLAREMQMQDLRERIERDDYVVDPDAIADAIVARLLSATRAKQSDDQCS